jgi:cell wall-associated NlpC family hydrolase
MQFAGAFDRWVDGATPGLMCRQSRACVKFSKRRGLVNVNRTSRREGFANFGSLPGRLRRLTDKPQNSKGFSRMPFQRPIMTAALFAALFVIAPVHAAESPAPVPMATPALVSLPMPLASLGPVLAQATLPADPSALRPAQGDIDASSQVGEVADLRQALVALAMKLRDVRYVRGGHSPSTGFDCSGFVRYVFAHAIGLRLPPNSARQFLAGIKVRRDDMQPGDLVFFHTRGRKRISHVGIYLDNGRFIHSPSAGKSVEVSSLDDAYWAKRFAGARRPEGIAQNG